MNNSVKWRKCIMVIFEASGYWHLEKNQLIEENELGWFSKDVVTCIGYKSVFSCVN